MNTHAPIASATPQDEAIPTGPRPGGRKVDAQILSRPLGRGEP